MQEIIQVLEFIETLDKFKDVLRIVRRPPDERPEDDAQHSWHLATMVVLLAPYHHEPIDVGHALKLAIFHDVPEIETGDVSSFDEIGRIGKAEREEAAMRRLVSQLPPEQTEEIMGYWLENEHKQTPEARFVQALDKMQPMIQNLISNGADWQQEPITETMLRQNKDHHYIPGTNLHALYNYIIAEGRREDILPT